MYPVEYNAASSVSYSPKTIGFHREEWQKHIILTDRMGSTKMVISPDETEKFDYLPFGKQVPRGGDDQRTAYIGKELDRESELGDHGVRKVDYELGRFTTIDPLWEKYYGWSPYQYSMNNPISYWDENGEFIPQVLGGAALGALIDGGYEYLSQVSGGNIFDLTSYDFSKKINWQKVKGKAIRGAFVGMFTMTGIPYTAEAGYLAYLTASGAAGNAFGGIAERTYLSEDDVFATEKIGSDILSGGLGALAGHGISKGFDKVRALPVLETATNKATRVIVDSAEMLAGSETSERISEAVGYVVTPDSNFEFKMPSNSSIQFKTSIKDNNRDNTNYQYPSNK